MSKILCKLGWHKYSRHYEILPLPASDPLQATIFKVCINCGKWWRGRDPETFKRNGIFSIVERKRADYNIPLYTSDYLLEKLPGLLDIDNKTFSVAVQAQVAPPNFVALYTHTSVVAGKLAGHSTRYINEADTPLKALLKLTIALSEAGELK